MALQFCVQVPAGKMVKRIGENRKEGERNVSAPFSSVRSASCRWRRLLLRRRRLPRTESLLCMHATDTLHNNCITNCITTCITKDRGKTGVCCVTGETLTTRLHNKLHNKVAQDRVYWLKLSSRELLCTVCFGEPRPRSARQLHKPSRPILLRSRIGLRSILFTMSPTAKIAAVG